MPLTETNTLRSAWVRVTKACHSRLSLPESTHPPHTTTPGNYGGEPPEARAQKLLQVRGQRQGNNQYRITSSDTQSSAQAGGRGWFLQSSLAWPLASPARREHPLHGIPRLLFAGSTAKRFTRGEGVVQVAKGVHKGRLPAPPPKYQHQHQHQTQARAWDG